MSRRTPKSKPSQKGKLLPKSKLALTVLGNSGGAHGACDSIEAGKAASHSSTENRSSRSQPRATRVNPSDKRLLQPPVVSFVSLGCAKNLVDSEAMLGRLAESGCMLTGDESLADTVVVNTCGFLESSRTEAVEICRELAGRKRAGKLKRIVVAGCLVQRDGEKLLDWVPEIDALVGVNNRDDIVRAVWRMDRDAALSLYLGDYHAASAGSENAGSATAGSAAAVSRNSKTAGTRIPSRSHPASAGSAGPVSRRSKSAESSSAIAAPWSDKARLRLTPQHYAYVRISEGCNQKCTFCTIPSIRGPMHCKTPDEIIDEGRELIADGASELLLIGQDTTSYGQDLTTDAFHSEPRAEASGPTHSGDASHRSSEPRAGASGVISGRRSVPALSIPPSPDSVLDLAALLRRLNAAWTDARWIRLMYVYPSILTDDMIDAIAESERIVKYIDIPLQHINDRMLKAMHRRVTRKQTETLLEKLRRRIPGVTIRTTFIVGFPGETETEFTELLDFIRDFRFDAAGAFKYSLEPETPAGRMRNQLDDAVKHDRRERFMLAQQAVAFEMAKSWIGRKFEVVVDQPAPIPNPSRERRASDARQAASARGGDAGGSIGRDNGSQFGGVSPLGRENTGAVGEDGFDNTRETHHGHYAIARHAGQAPDVDSICLLEPAPRAKFGPGDVAPVECIATDAYDLIVRPTKTRL